MSDAYIAYTHRFFRRWLPVYDLFALPVFWVYRAVARLAAPAPGRTVLDLCTGTGEVALRLARRGARVIAVDVTPDMLERARRKAGDLAVDLRLADARALPLPDRAVDATTLSFALHDMPRGVRLAVLREALRVTRERVVILDYDFGSGPLGRAAARLVALYETAYLPRFAEEGVAPLLAELGIEARASRRLFPGIFRWWVIDAGPQWESPRGGGAR